jgi:signal transduction histidine kinase
VSSERTAVVVGGHASAPVAVHVAVQEERRVQVPYLAVALRALIENAVAASPPGGHVDVWVRGACVEVRDQGPGFATGARPGLGLTAARAVARRSGGDLLVCDRTDGPGARVILTLR